MTEGAAGQTIVTRAPTRLDFGGGWTDVPPYCDREGGFVCNIAIDRYATAVAVTGEPPVAVPATGRPPRTRPPDPLVGAVLKRTGNIAGLRLSLENDFPLGAGLGGSSAASAALLGAVSAARGQALDRREIAEEGRRIEVEDLGVAGGRQDHYAATHGGALALRFSDKVALQAIPLSREAREAIERRAVLVYTGESRISGDTIAAVIAAYERREPRVLQALARMKALAEQMAGSLGSGDIDGLGRLMGEHWTHQRELHPSIPTARIDEIVARAAAARALGAKAMGASGGGCVLVIAREEDVEGVREIVGTLGAIVPFRVDTGGLARLD